ncbi:MAG: FkbM family methyltransferase [Mucilaginibacter sp.]|nr:FkbM family methyltransferase [Mucilaginibacter sp.]
MRCERNGIYLKNINLLVPIQSIDKFHGDFELISRMAQYTSFSFEDEEMIASVSLNNHVTNIIIRNYDSLSTVEDVFISKTYSFDHDITDNFIVIDIGLNIGIAALYFATFPSVKKVYGYEPFQLNYLIAKKNLELNPGLSKKIIVQNTGVGSKNKLLRVPFMNEGDVGFSTTDFAISSVQNNSNKTAKYVDVNLIGINEVLKEVFENDFANEKIYLKLDCEGAEYEILQALSDNNELKCISVIELEWHYQGAKELMDILEKNNFQITFSDENINGYTGIIRAKR